MKITDEQVEAAMYAYACDDGNFRDRIRAALEAAAQADPVPEYSIPDPRYITYEGKNEAGQHIIVYDTLRGPVRVVVEP